MRQGLRCLMPAALLPSSRAPLQIWGNHSTTQVPDFVNARIGGRPAIDVIGDMKWFRSALRGPKGTCPFLVQSPLPSSAAERTAPQRTLICLPGALPP